MLTHILSFERFLEKNLSSFRFHSVFVPGRWSPGPGDAPVTDRQVLAISCDRLQVQVPWSALRSRAVQVKVGKLRVQAGRKRMGLGG